MKLDAKAKRTTWKQEEVDELLKLIRMYGLGKWGAIMKHGSSILQHRSKVLGPFLLGTICSGRHTYTLLPSSTMASLL